MNVEIKKYFLKILNNSLNTAQVNLLGEKLDSKFNVYEVSGFSTNTPLPRKTAADTLLSYFTEDNDIVQLFTIMLRNEGSRFYNSTLNIWGREEFIQLLKRYKWIYDDTLIRFFLDPFYEHEINFLNQIRVIDLRNDVPIKDIIKGIETASSKLSIRDLEWRITMRLYDLEPKTAELIRKIIEMLLVRQNLQKLSFELFTCLKELAINATKANYKLIYEKYFTRKNGITPDKDYYHFLRLFKNEISEHGNMRLVKLAREMDKFINITFQSTNDSISIWVTNSDNISLIEKQEILKKIRVGGLQNRNIYDDDDEFSEGAGFGLNIILSILNKYSGKRDPLKVVFYPGFIKIGFELQRSQLVDKIE